MTFFYAIINRDFIYFGKFFDYFVLHTKSYYFFPGAA